MAPWCLMCGGVQLTSSTSFRMTSSLVRRFSCDGCFNLKWCDELDRTSVENDSLCSIYVANRVSTVFSGASELFKCAKRNLYDLATAESRLLKSLSPKEPFHQPEELWEKAREI
ncbi:hypothetical protein BDZ45DRAFT_744173 [Acephala macrosclerotiorum]|nr:hypothetical protein BDZ45DRAFT_744173 [Acephala macrosclerotiorum]